VYAAVETGVRRQVALKVQPKLQLTNSAAAILQLQREVQIHSRLHHQNICGLWGYMHDLKHCYMVLEKCDNGHLYDELIRQNKFDNATSVFYTKQLIAALQYCHDRHVIHRDIKLENMLLHGNTLKLADFGWAVHVPGKHDGARLTLCGSPAYVSPEIVEGRPHGHWTDLWSVGVVAYEMLHGTPPFEAATERGIFDRIRCVDLIFPEAAVVMKRRGRRSVGKEDVEDEVQDGGHGKDGSNEGAEMMRVPADANNRAREMIQGLLSYEPKERWSLEKCLQSMWMS
jgi:serine/threonine protein kinase